MVDDHSLQLQRNMKSISKEEVITKLHPSDVLLGRGSPTINYGGNIAFRALIKARKAEYTASGQHKMKDRVSREILQIIVEKGGRFLRRVDPMELEKLDIACDEKAWCVVEEEVALEKVKQALRDKDPARQRGRAREAIALQQQQFPPRTSEPSESLPLVQAWMLQNLLHQQTNKDLLLLANIRQHLERKQIIDNLTNQANSNGPMASLLTLQASSPFTMNTNPSQPPTNMFLFR